MYYFIVGDWSLTIHNAKQSFAWNVSSKYGMSIYDDNVDYIISPSHKNLMLRVIIESQWSWIRRKYFYRFVVLNSIHSLYDKDEVKVYNKIK